VDLYKVNYVHNEGGDDDELFSLRVLFGTVAVVVRVVVLMISK